MAGAGRVPSQELLTEFSCVGAGIYALVPSFTALPGALAGS